MALVERGREQLPEGVFLPTIDYNMSIWMAYQNCINAPIFGKHSDSFVSMVRLLTKMILKDWQDETYRNEVDNGTKTPIEFFGAITELLHRRHFFEKTEREDLVG